MVLAELGQRISQALGSLNSTPVVDEAVSARLRRLRLPAGLHSCVHLDCIEFCL